MPQSNVTDIWTLSDLCTPWCVHVVATLRIADHIVAGKTAITDLAAASACDADSLHRVLRHLVSKGLFEESAPGRFALNEPARALLESWIRLGLDLDGFGGRMAYAWGSLIDAVRTGAPAYHTIFGRPFWEDLQAHPDLAASFDALMGPAGHGTPDPDVLVTGDWDSVRTVVDVGGGTGALLAEVLRCPTHGARHAGRSPYDGGAIRRDLPGGRRRRTGHGRRAELLRPAARRCRSLSAEERPRRLARSRGAHHPETLRQRRASRRSRHRSQRGDVRRRREPVAGLADDGVGGRKRSPVGGVQSDGSRGGTRRARGRAAGVRALRRGMSIDIVRCDMLRALVRHDRVSGAHDTKEQSST